MFSGSARHNGNVWEPHNAFDDILESLKPYFTTNKECYKILYLLTSLVCCSNTFHPIMILKSRHNWQPTLHDNSWNTFWVIEYEYEWMIWISLWCYSLITITFPGAKAAFTNPKYWWKLFQHFTLFLNPRKIQIFWSKIPLLFSVCDWNLNFNPIADAIKWLIPSILVHTFYYIILERVIVNIWPHGVR